jgi:hypothetical protein
VDNLWTTRQKIRSSLSHIFATYLTHALRCKLGKRAAGADSSRSRFQLLGAIIALSATLTQINLNTANASIQTDQFKLYAHSRIINYEEFKCFVKLINEENRHWNPKAKNGSHYGIGQMKNEKYKTSRRIHADRLDSSLHTTSVTDQRCNAWAFFKANSYH